MAEVQGSKLVEADFWRRMSAQPFLKLLERWLQDVAI